MKCTSCSADLTDNARFCPFCGQPVPSGASETQQPEPDAAVPESQPDPLMTQILMPSESVAQPQAEATPEPQAPAGDPLMTQILMPSEPVAQPQAEAAPEPQAPANDPFKTQIMYDPNANGQTQSYGATSQQQAQPYGTAQSPVQPAYGTTAQMPAQPGAQQPYGQPAYGAPVPPQGAPQYQQYQQPPQYQAQQLPVDNGGATAKKSKKLPIIIGVAVAVVIAATLGVCAALGVGPFGGGGGGGGNSGVYRLDPNSDALAQLDAVVKDIQESGNFDGTYDISMKMDLGSLGTAVGMSTLDYSMKGTYSLENYNPNDLSKLKMHMTMDMDAMGQTMNAVIDYADGMATLTSDGQTQTQPMSEAELKSLFEQSGGMAYDSSTISGFIKSSRIEGDTIILELDSDFVNSLLANSLGGSGLEGAEAMVDNLELRAKVGNGTLEESVNVKFDMSYMGATMSADMAVNYTMAKK